MEKTKISLDITVENKEYLELDIGANKNAFVAQAIDAHREEKWQYNKEKAIMGRKRK
jgi:post-segregation antitoxin (ccd killing protein)